MIGTLMIVVPAPARVSVRAVVDSVRLTGFVLKVSVAPPVRLLVTAKLPPLFCRLYPIVALPANSIELVPLMTPNTFVSRSGVCSALAPVVSALLADWRVPPETLATPPLCPAAMNGCAAFMITVPSFSRMPCVLTTAD